MNQIEHNRKLGEILRQAREALNEELLAKQTSAYQIWLDSCNLSWRSKGTLLPPNSIKLIYPTETDIVNRALEIYNTLNPKVEVVPAPTVTNTDADEPVTEVAVTEVSAAVVAEDAKVDESTAEELLLVEPKEQPIVTEPGIKDKFTSLLTKWGGQGHY